MADTDPPIRIIDVLRTSDRLHAKGKPTREYRLPGLNVHAYSKPAHNDSGDLYALYYLRENKTALFIGDIAGHDFSSAIIATEVLQYIENNHRRLTEPGDFLQKIGADMLKKFQSLQRFMTAAVFLFDTSEGNFRLASAGHPASVLYDSAAGTTEILRLSGFPIGFEEANYETIGIEFQTGDLLVITTDGVITAKNEAEEEFGYDRIERCIKEASGDPAGTLTAIVSEIEKFKITESTLDDCTVLCLKRAG
ncbi:MAG: PP2C family protein-serine/threonine phosphatase [bacterium]